MNGVLELILFEDIPDVLGEPVDIASQVFFQVIRVPTQGLS